MRNALGYIAILLAVAMMFITFFGTVAFLVYVLASRFFL